MKNATASSLQVACQQGLRLDCNCSYTAVREAAAAIRCWLESQGLPEEELGAWELALVEAGNNAVEHVSEQKRTLPLTMEISAGEHEVLARVTDHTSGFDFPENVDLPDLESEGGRGLFLIKTLTDQVSYLRGAGENQLILRKARRDAAKPGVVNLVQLQRQLAESEMAIGEMSEELASSYESLVAMFRYSAELGKTGELANFARPLLADILQLTESDAVVLRLLESGSLNTYLVLPAGLEEPVSSLNTAAIAPSVELEALKTREDVWFDAKHPLPAQDPLQAIQGAQNGMVHMVASGEQPLGTIALIRTRRDQPMRSAQVNILHTLTDFLAIQIVNSRLQEERMQSRVTRRELEIAATIQRSLLPVSIPSLAPFSVAASCTNAREVGGDFYDVLRVGQDGLLIIIADVMGKGVPAAFFAAVLRSAVRSMPALYSEPAALLTSVNRILCEDLSRVDMFVTAQAVYLDVHRKCLLSASAGHCPTLIAHSGGQPASLIEEANLPLGIDYHLEYSQASVPLPPGSTVLIYTDGLTEACDSKGQMYSFERLETFLSGQAAGQKSAVAIRDALHAELENFRGTTPLADDQTFVLLHHDL